MEAVEQVDVLSQEPMNEAFCEKHLALQEKSGLSRKKYCRVNNIHYDRFNYWARKAALGRVSTTAGQAPLITVKLKNNSEPLISSEAICSLSLKNEYLLRIHTLEALSFILERMS